MAFDSTLSAAHALTSNAPQQPLTLVAVCGGGGCPHLKIVWGGAGNGINEGLEGLLVDVTLLQGKRGKECSTSRVKSCFAYVEMIEKLLA